MKPKEIGPFDWQDYDPSWRRRSRRRRSVGRAVFGMLMGLLAALLAIGLVTLPMWVFLI